jgi:hypothetical protein
VRLDRPVKAYARWMQRIPNAYREAVLDEEPQPGVTIDNDPHCLAALEHYRSLMPLAQEARKPMFTLKPLPATCPMTASCTGPGSVLEVVRAALAGRRMFG